MIHHDQANNIKITTITKERRNGGSHFGYMLAFYIRVYFWVYRYCWISLPANNFDNHNIGSPLLLYPHIYQRHFSTNADYLNSNQWHSYKINNNDFSAIHYLSSLYPSQPALLHSILYLCGNYQLNSD